MKIHYLTFELDLGVTVTRNVTQYPQHHVTFTPANFNCTGPRSAVGNVSGYRCVSDCRSRGREFDPSPVPYFRGD